MVILSIDQATKSGWAVIVDGHLAASGHQDFSPHRSSSRGMLFLQFRSTIQYLIQQWQPDLIVNDRSYQRGSAANEIIKGLTAIIEMEAAAAPACEYFGIQPNALKKWATGKGNASKEEMIEAAMIKTGHPSLLPFTHDEADAILMGLYAWEEFGHGARR